MSDDIIVKISSWRGHINAIVFLLSIEFISSTFGLYFNFVLFKLSFSSFHSVSWRQVLWTSILWFRFLLFWDFKFESASLVALIPFIIHWTPIERGIFLLHLRLFLFISFFLMFVKCSVWAYSPTILFIFIFAIHHGNIWIIVF